MKNKSFTLIELLVVIVIIGILAGVIMISTSSSINKANIAKSKAFEESVLNNLVVNMVSRWKFDEKTGSDPYYTPDAWGNNIGTLNGSTAPQIYPQLQDFSECVTNSCFKFDGVDDYINLGNSDLPSTGALTLSTWIKSNSNITSLKNVLGRLYYSEISYGIQIDNYNSLRAKYHNSSSTPFYVYGGTIDPNEFYNVVITYIPNMSNNARIYVNGILKDDETISGTLGIHSYVFAGGAYTNRFFSGLIDDVRIYNAALSSSKIKQNYIAGLDLMLANGNISKEEHNQRIELLGSSF